MLFLYMKSYISDGKFVTKELDGAELVCYYKTREYGALGSAKNDCLDDSTCTGVLKKKGKNLFQHCDDDPVRPDGNAQSGFGHQGKTNFFKKVDPNGTFHLIFQGLMLKF